MKLKYLLPLLVLIFSVIGFSACTDESEQILPSLEESNSAALTGGTDGVDEHPG